MKMISESKSFQRTAGALLPIFSLPGEYGIGVLGKEARSFADFLVSSGLHCWQVLPTVHAGAGNSPYSGVSAFAGDPLFIDPEALFEKGLITEEELISAHYFKSLHKVDYEWLLNHKPTLLKKAFQRITPAIKEEIERFKEENNYWLIDYALFMTCKEKKMNIKSKSLLSDEEIQSLKNDEIFSYYCFVQYEFYSEWSQLKTYCNEKGIGLIGDLPFYVSYDSSDVWAHPQLFLLDEDLEPIGIAGTPPDYFSEDGQCWGNPLYNWSRMEEDQYEWWLSRMAFHLKNNDAMRIDHFRGFERFWYIPAEESSAKKGHWETGPGLIMFELYEKKYGPAPIIAEDLGTLDENFFAFLKKSGYPGMKVMQFAFDGSDTLHLPHNYVSHSVAYTGTHDNNTTIGWIWEAGQAERERAINYCNIPTSHWGEGGPHSPACQSFIRTLYQSVSNIAIVPLQDFCGFGADTRTNIPGEALNNWNFRFTKENIQSIDQDFLLNLSQTYRRNNAFKFFGK